MMDGAAVVREAWADGLRPDPEISVSRWAADYRRVAAESGSPFPGRWDPMRVPYTREVMDCLSPSHPARKVITAKGSQLALSECGVNLFGMVAHLAPAPMIIMLPTDAETAKYNALKLDPTINETEELRRRVAGQRSRTEKGSTTRFKKFAGGYVQLVSASTSSSLQMISARYMIYEECSEYPEDVGERGHPIDQARTRSDAWADERKEYFCSTPGIKGRCRITKEYETADLRLRLYVACPCCGWYTTYTFDRLTYQECRPHGAKVTCANPDCKHGIGHADKKAAYATGAYAWVPLHDGDGVIHDDALSPEDTADLKFDPWSAKGMAIDSVGFAVSQLYSPFKSFDDVAAQLIAAEEDPKKAKVTCQQVKGEPYDEGGNAPPWQDLLVRREAYQPGTLPGGALMLTAGADVQADRIEIEIVAWGPRTESWSVDYLVLEGNTTQPQVWKDLDEVLARSYPDPRCGRWPIDLVAIDNGYRTKEVNAWVARHPGRVMVIKGDSGSNDAPFIRKGSKVFTTASGRKVGLHQWIAGVFPLTRDIYDYLSLAPGEDKPPACYMHFPMAYTSRACDEAHFRQLTAEYLREHKDGKRAFVCPSGVRNEALDCRKYALAAAYRLGIPYHTPEVWAKIAEQRGLSGEADQTSPDLPLFAAVRQQDATNAVRLSPQSTPTPPPTPPPGSQPAAVSSLGGRLAQLNR